MRYRSDIDGLRAIAVLSVLIYHLNHNFLPGGFLGVDIFFVISGYLLTTIIIKEMQNNKFRFSNFYNRRIKRILPAFFFVCLVAFVAGFFMLLPEQSGWSLGIMARSLFFWQNMYLATIAEDYFSPTAYDTSLLHTWSLAVEEQFYFILPISLFLLYAFKVNARGIFAIFLLSIFISFMMSVLCIDSSTLAKYNYYWLPSRFGELLIGSCLALILLKKPNNLSLFLNNFLSCIALLALLACLYFIDDSILIPSFFVAIPCVAAALLIYANTSTCNCSISSDSSFVSDSSMRGGGAIIRI